MSERLKIRTRSESLNEHYDKCLELHCCICQHYLLTVIQETKAKLQQQERKEVTNG